MSLIDVITTIMNSIDVKTLLTLGIGALGEATQLLNTFQQILEQILALM